MRPLTFVGRLKLRKVWVGKTRNDSLEVFMGSKKSNCLSVLCLIPLIDVDTALQFRHAVVFSKNLQIIWNFQHTKDSLKCWPPRPDTLSSTIVCRFNSNANEHKVTGKYVCEATYSGVPKILTSSPIFRHICKNRLSRLVQILTADPLPEAPPACPFVCLSRLSR